MRFLGVLVALALSSLTFTGASSMRGPDGVRKLKQPSVTLDFWTSPRYDFEGGDENSSDGPNIEAINILRKVEIGFGTAVLFEINQHINNKGDDVCPTVDNDGVELVPAAREQVCAESCTNGRRYCEPPPTDISVSVKGNRIVEEALRRQCIWKKFHDNNDWDKEKKLFEYLASYHARDCYTKGQNKKRNCVSRVLDDANITEDVVNDCFEESGGLQEDAENKIFQEQAKKTRLRGVNDFPSLPAVVINGQRVDEISETAIFTTVCKLLREEDRIDACDDLMMEEQLGEDKNPDEVAEEDKEVDQEVAEIAQENGGTEEDVLGLTEEEQDDKADQENMEEKKEDEELGLTEVQEEAEEAEEQEDEEEEGELGLEAIEALEEGIDAVANATMEEDGSDPLPESPEEEGPPPGEETPEEGDASTNSTEEDGSETPLDTPKEGEEFDEGEPSTNSTEEEGSETSLDTPEEGEEFDEGEPSTNSTEEEGSETPLDTPEEGEEFDEGEPSTPVDVNLETSTPQMEELNSLGEQEGENLPEDEGTEAAAETVSGSVDETTHAEVDLETEMEKESATEEPIVPETKDFGEESVELDSLDLSLVDMEVSHLEALNNCGVNTAVLMNKLVQLGSGGHLKDETEDIESDLPLLMTQNCPHEEGVDILHRLRNFHGCAMFDLQEVIETFPSTATGVALRCANAYQNMTKEEEESGFIPEACIRTVEASSVLGRGLFGLFLYPDVACPCFEKLGDGIPECTADVWPIPINGALIKTQSCLVGQWCQTIDGLCEDNMGTLNECLPPRGTKPGDMDCDTIFEGCSDVYEQVHPMLNSAPLPDACVRIAQGSNFYGTHLVQRYDAFRHQCGQNIELWEGHSKVSEFKSFVQEGVYGIDYQSIPFVTGAVGGFFAGVVFAIVFIIVRNICICARNCCRRFCDFICCRKKNKRSQRPTSKDYATVTTNVDEVEAYHD